MLLMLSHPLDRQGGADDGGDRAQEGGDPLPPHLHGASTSSPSPSPAPRSCVIRCWPRAIHPAKPPASVAPMADRAVMATSGLLCFSPSRQIAVTTSHSATPPPMTPTRTCGCQRPC